jgi:CRISPR/Cas system-associated exonuclease Cas4 (RecB family)
MPQVTENKELEKYFVDNLTRMYNERERIGIHVSDLVYCLRKPYYRKYVPVSQSLKTLLYFLDGEQRHKGFQGLVPNLENEVEIDNYGIVGTMDLFDPCSIVIGKCNGMGIIEIKTTRAKPRGIIPPHYLRQGAYYCIVKDTNKFTLMTQHINHSEVVFQDIEFNDEELNVFKEQMLNDKDILAVTFSLVNVKLKEAKTLEEAQEIILKYAVNIPPAREGMEWMCNNCEYEGNCAKIQIPLK